MQETIDTLLKYGYVFLFIYSLGGGMVGILAAGVLSASAKMDLYTSILVAFVGNVIGSSLLFVLGKYYKKDLMPYFKKHRRKLALAVIKIKQYGYILLFVQKFIYGLKTFIPIAAGLARYNTKNFFFINLFASLIWAILLGYVAFIFGWFIELIFDKLGNYPYIAPLFLVILVILILFYLSKFSKKKGVST
ncbi:MULTISPECIES: DedA family protein [unclassified Campylobacter]|uniref:DedA family protein n=1 Tax=unclassified Campylobacter TaxID=2593542 RepID=UPI0012380EA7|nr:MULTISPECIES: DedA family protein [unclassified Campylobacter]KAA6226675.1 DedA family protein [Campylobacter sp. LR286c]KAA6227695.1 DedA family protein [Campylobacter sp. LR196d]KAA6227707.1 DedA family protein [Campylobacter sp. LR185c]KAA6231238.1 DedA family protein [Campylobacter sp. LR291e]KAA6234127.1 DedA family protein [Campylobacter sp. LR264d]